MPLTGSRVEILIYDDYKELDMPNTPDGIKFEMAIRYDEVVGSKEDSKRYFFDLWVGEDDIILGDMPITEEQYARLKQLGIVEV